MDGSPVPSTHDIIDHILNNLEGVEYMELISEEHVEKTWREVAQLTPARVNKEILAFGKSQPDLLAFIVSYTEDITPEIKKLGVYLAFVIYKMFHGLQNKIPRVSSKEILACYADNEHYLQSFEGIHERLLERIVTTQQPKQPHVMNYIIEALMEDPEENEICELPEEDKGFLFILLKTIMEVLNQKV